MLAFVQIADFLPAIIPPLVTSKLFAKIHRSEKAICYNAHSLPNSYLYIGLVSAGILSVHVVAIFENSKHLSVIFDYRLFKLYPNFLMHKYHFYAISAYYCIILCHVL